jgi:IMP dehydrogenase
MAINRSRGEDGRTYLEDGFLAHELFNKGYDDVFFYPNHIDFSTKAMDLTTYLTKNIIFRTPCMSSPMDIVIESLMEATMMALGGTSFVHCNNLPHE